MNFLKFCPNRQPDYNYFLSALFYTEYRQTGRQREKQNKIQTCETALSSSNTSARLSRLKLSPF